MNAQNQDAFLHHQCSPDGCCRRCPRPLGVVNDPTSPWMISNLNINYSVRKYPHPSIHPLERRAAICSGPPHRASHHCQPLDSLPNHGEFGILLDGISRWQARIAPPVHRPRTFINARRPVGGRLKPVRVAVAHAQCFQRITRNKVIGMPRNPRLRPPHRTAHRDNKRSQPRHAGSDDDDVRFRAGERSESEVGARRGGKDMLTPPTVESRPTGLGHDEGSAARTTIQT